MNKIHFIKKVSIIFNVSHLLHFKVNNINYRVLRGYTNDLCFTGSIAYTRKYCSDVYIQGNIVIIAQNNKVHYTNIEIT